jgi:hypothetical protein
MASNQYVESARAAAGMRVTLSTFVITAALGAIAAQATLTTFILDKRTNLAWYYVAAIFGLAFLVISIVFGAKGITDIYKDGYCGNWLKETGGGKLPAQAIFAVLGLFCVALSTFAGDTKAQASPELRRIAKLERAVESQQMQLRSLNTRDAGVEESVKELRTAVERFRTQIRMLQQTK